jgi:flagellar hook-basal body complex protein FliE
MADPLGLISNSGGVDRNLAPLPKMPGQDRQEPGFEKLLKEQIDKVNQLQADAREAVEDLAAGRRDDVESVLVATQKADTAFKLLLQVRNKVMTAYDEVKQIRL